MVEISHCFPGTPESCCTSHLQALSLDRSPLFLTHGQLPLSGASAVFLLQFRRNTMPLPTLNPSAASPKQGPGDGWSVKFHNPGDLPDERLCATHLKGLNWGRLLRPMKKLIHLIAGDSSCLICLGFFLNVLS